MSPRLVMLCGLAFAGKSTLARRLADRIGGRVVSLDAINAERGAGHGGAGLAVEVWAETHRIALRRADAVLARGASVIVDDTCCFRRLRDDWREVARRRGAGAGVVALDVPFEEIARRRAASERSGDRESIREDVLRSLHDAFEWPGDDENVLWYRHGENLDAWIEERFPSGSGSP